MLARHPYSFGIEEEYFVVSRKTGNIKTELPAGFMKDARRNSAAS